MTVTLTQISKYRSQRFTYMSSFLGLDKILNFDPGYRPLLLIQFESYILNPALDLGFDVKTFLCVCRISNEKLSTVGVRTSPSAFLGQVTMVKNSLPGWFQRGPQESLVHVNVGGLKRSLCFNTLKKFPDTRLGKLLACNSEEDILQVGSSQPCDLHPSLQVSSLCLCVVVVLISKLISKLKQLIFS